MSRLTVSLNDAIHLELKEASARQGRPIGKIIEEGLILRGIKPVSRAGDLVAQARAHTVLTEAEALDLAATETRAHRTR